MAPTEALLPALSDPCALGNFYMVGRVRLIVYADSAIFSGAEALLCDVVSGLAEEPDFQLSVAAPPGNPELVEKLCAAASTSLTYEVPAQPLRLAAFHIFDPRRLRQIRSSLAAAETDAMLVNLPSLEYGPTPLVANVLPGVPKVGLAHITGSMRALDFHLGTFREALARRAARGLDRVMVLSDQAAAEFPRLWHRPDLPIDVIRMPVPEIYREDRDAARAKLGLPSEARLIGIAGRITLKQKGHDTLLAAAPAIVAEHPDVHFAVAGQGKDLDVLIKKARKSGMDRHFSFLGHVSPISTFLSALDLIAIPSRFEGLPLIGLEALHLGVPGVAASVDGLCDIWPERWRVPSGDADRLARGLKDLLSAGPELRDEMIAAGRQLAEPRIAANASVDVAAVLRELDRSRWP